MNELQKEYQNEIREIADAANRLASLGYVRSLGGNLSYRVAEDVLLITPTQVPKADIRFDDICIINFNKELLFASPGRRPTGEMAFHTDILRKRSDLNALVHAHPAFCTGLAIAHDQTLASPLLPEMVLEVGPVLSIPYYEPLTQKLADAFDQVIFRTNAVLMQNHGIVVGSGGGVRRGTQLLEMIETTAQSVVVAKTMGKLNYLTKEDIQNLDRVMKTLHIPLPGGPDGPYSTLMDLYFPIEDN